MTARHPIARDLGKPTIDLLNATLAVIDRDLGQGFVTPERLKRTILARKDLVRELEANGMSQRQIAKAVRVSAQQVNRDLRGRKASLLVSPKVTPAPCSHNQTKMIGGRRVNFWTQRAE
jgi:hypothetical protein